MAVPPNGLRPPPAVLILFFVFLQGFSSLSRTASITPTASTGSAHGDVGVLVERVKTRRFRFKAVFQRGRRVFSNTFGARAKRALAARGERQGGERARKTRHQIKREARDRCVPCATTVSREEAPHYPVEGKAVSLHSLTTHGSVFLEFSEDSSRSSPFLPSVTRENRSNRTPEKMGILRRRAAALAVGVTLVGAGKHTGVGCACRRATLHPFFGFEVFDAAR